MTIHDGFSFGIGIVCGIAYVLIIAAVGLWAMMLIWNAVANSINWINMRWKLTIVTRKINRIKRKYSAEHFKEVDFSKLDMHQLNVLDESLEVTLTKPCRHGRDYE
jgi:hypothetical protein